MKKNSLPWAHLFRSVTVGLGYKPKDFWEMTLPEYLMLVESPPILSRQEIAQLMKKFPD